MRILLPLLVLVAACTGSDPDAPRPSDAPPYSLLGTFEDDYGTTYDVTTSTWRHGSTTYEVVEWNADARYLLATSEVEGEPRAWSRIDWTILPPSADEGVASPWTWAWCMAAWDAPTREAVLEAPPSRREEPRTGCGDDFPFTRMRPTPPPSA